MLDQSASAQARGYRALVHRLLCCGDPRVVAVTSASPGEGKTTCASNLALAIAEDTMTSVLLLDANLRRPALAEVFGLAPPDSFVADLSRFVHVARPYPVVGIYGVRLHIAALPRLPMVERRLERTLFSVAVLDLRSVYDYIVIDAASVLESGDVDVVGECADGVIVATRAGTSRRADLGRAVELLNPAAVLGSVIVDS
jgi:Mrp family chromosome partitioning ATPase